MTGFVVPSSASFVGSPTQHCSPQLIALLPSVFPLSGLQGKSTTHSLLADGQVLMASDCCVDRELALTIELNSFYFFSNMFFFYVTEEAQLI